MKTLSLWQPWATLVVIGAKRNETRSWPTAYQGSLLIHAAKHFTPDEKMICMREPFYSVLKAAGFHPPYDLPTGSIIGMVDQTGCVHVETVRDGLSKQELAFGNYADDRFAHTYTNPVRFARLTPYSGSQRYFYCDIPLHVLQGERT